MSSPSCVGVPLGVLMGRSVARRPPLAALGQYVLSAPLSALVPVIMVLFGFGETTIILTVVLFAIWIIVLDARAGVRAHLALARRDGAQLRRQPLAGLQQDLSSGRRCRKSSPASGSA